MMSKSLKNTCQGDYCTLANVSDVVTGKEDANFSVPNGKYKFFTCSNDTLTCNDFVWDKSAVLIAGNGDFNVKLYTGKFNAYQRTYVLTPPEEYYGLVYMASLYRINSFKSASAGSIVKFIAKADIENIPLFIPKDTSYLQCMNKLIHLQEKNNQENGVLVSLRDWLLPMLMNGQAIISN